MNDIKDLAQVSYFTVGTPAPSLARHKIDHGFTGKGSEPPAAAHVKQVHGTALIEARAIGQNKTEADGVYTFAPGLPVAVKTADCLPILMVDRNKTLAAAIHAGWRGLTAGIIMRAVDLFREKGLTTGDVLVAIGPSVSVQTYQVGCEVIEALHGQDLGLTPVQAALCTVKGSSATGRGHWHADLRSASVFAFFNQGVSPTHLSVMDGCTASLSQLWYSYRRDGLMQGHNWSYISL